MNCIISQPIYITFIAYIQRLNYADIFVYLDDVQRQGRGYENRNRILNNGSTQWVTIPIKSSSRECIANVDISGDGFVQKHKNIMYNAYSKCKYFDEDLLEYIYSNLPLYQGITDFTENVVKIIENTCFLLSFTPRTIRASELSINHSIVGPEHLVQIAEFLGADMYISGKNGPAYGVYEAFKGSMEVSVHKPITMVYKQKNVEEFIPHLAFVDALFNAGLETVKCMVRSPLSLT